jgi:uncharacterized membrane protein
MSSLPGERFDRLDALRAVAIVWMAVFHFLFDLNHYGYLQPRHSFHHDALWVSQRTVIVSLFLFCAGLGVAVAQAQGQSWARFWRRWAQVAGCAVLVTASSYWMYPKSFIYFGVLHGMAVMLLILRLSAARWRGSDALWWLAGAMVLALAWAAPALVQSDPRLTVFNERWLNWIGLISHKPITEDYVPLLPWLGLMLWGFAGTRWVLRHRPTWLAGPLPPGGRALAVLGTWSLSYYMLHQPVMIGLLSAARWLGLG